MIYPCDISPTPVLCYSTAKLASAYVGSAVDVYNPDTTTTQTIGFSGSALDTVSLDAFLAGETGLVTKFYDQISAKHLTQTVVSTEAPSIQDLAIGGARSIVFQGESQSGAIYSLVSPDISSLGITAKDYSVIMVVQPSSSMYCNQAGAPDLNSGALFDMQGTGGTVTQLLNNSVLGDRGAWQVTDGTFDFVSPMSFVQINPSVIGITSDSTGVKLYQNGQIRATASRSALTRTAATLYLGKLASSVAGGTSKAGGFSIVAAMFYNVGLTQTQYAFVAAALYERFSIDPRTSTHAANQVIVLGDSAADGYVSLGKITGGHYLQSLITKQPTRFLSFAVPGSTVTQNPLGGPVYANTEGLFPLAATPQLKATDANKGRIVIIHAGGNDTGLGPVPRTGVTHSNTTIDGISDTSDIDVGDYVYAPNISVLTTVASKTASSITTTAPGPTTSTTVTLTFTRHETSPAVVKTALQSLVDQAITAGATKVIVGTILPRNVDYQPWLTALNVEIAGITSATIVDCANFPGLNTNPGPSYADASHPSALGHQQWASCFLSEVDSGLQ